MHPILSAILPAADAQEAPASVARDLLESALTADLEVAAAAGAAGAPSPAILFILAIVLVVLVGLRHLQTLAPAAGGAWGRDGWREPVVLSTQGGSFSSEGADRAAGPARRRSRRRADMVQLPDHVAASLARIAARQRQEDEAPAPESGDQGVRPYHRGGVDVRIG